MGVVNEATSTDPQQPETSGAPKDAPSTTPKGGSPQAGESTGAGVRTISFQTLPPFVKARLSNDLFEDPLLTPTTMAELQEKMKWSYQFMRVVLHLSSTFPSYF